MQQTLAFLFFLMVWVYRLSRLQEILQQGYLPDFFGYYKAAYSVIAGNVDSAFIVKTHFGPPFILLPYLPLALLPFPLAEYVLTLLNLICYFFVFYLLWKKYYTRLTWFFWVFMGLLAFCFPIIFSLGSGNPIGIITLGIYSIWIIDSPMKKSFFYFLAVLWKLFPLVLLPMLLFSMKKKKIIITKKYALLLFLYIGISTLLTLYFIPTETWRLYQANAHNVFANPIPDTAVYNQSLSSSLARMGFSFHTYTLPYWLFVGIICMTLLIMSKKIPQAFAEKQLDLGILILCATLLLHPFPWQYYFAIFLPFLLIKIPKNPLLYGSIFLLLCIDGGRIPILSNAQFFGCLLLFFTLALQFFFFFLPKKP